MTTIVNTVVNYLVDLNSHPRDKRIEFDEPTHIYTIDGKQGYTSCTTWIHEHFPHFNAEKASNNIMRGKKILDPNYEHYGCNAEEIRTKWKKNGDQASFAGTSMHNDIECYYNNIFNKNDTVEFRYFKEFVAANPDLKPYRAEWRVFHEEWKIAGAIDMIYENPDGTLLIYDWKRAKDIQYENQYGETALPKYLKHITNTNFWHYAFQLNAYKTLIEANYGKKVVGLCLVCLHPNNREKTFRVVELPMLDVEMADIVNARKEKLGLV
jgi:ATP-dependent exoDNAse (exonuclease V) beta subunit